MPLCKQEKTLISILASVVSMCYTVHVHLSNSRHVVVDTHLGLYVPRVLRPGLGCECRSRHGTVSGWIHT